MDYLFALLALAHFILQSIMFKFTQSMKYSTMRDVGVASFGTTLVSAVLLFSDLFSDLFSGLAAGILAVVVLISGSLTSCMLDSYILRFKANEESAVIKTKVASTPSATEKPVA